MKKKLRKIAISIFSTFFIFAFIELSSWCILNLTTYRNNIFNSIFKAIKGNTESSNINNLLYQKGLPKKFKSRGSSKDNNIWFDLMSASPSYSDYPWAEDFWSQEYQEFKTYEQNSPMRFQPNVIWRFRKRESTYVNMNNEGLRKTINPNFQNSDNPKKIFMFGGSTMYGFGVPDQYTIPSYLSYQIKVDKPKFSFQITNFGTNSYVIDQEVQLFIDELRKGNIPDMVIFYHGINDTYASLVDPGRPMSYMIPPQMGKKLIDKNYINSNNNIGIEQLHVYILLSKIKQRLINLLHQQNEQKSGIKSTKSTELQAKSLSFIKSYKETLKIIQSICKTYGIKVYFLWQPVLPYGNKKYSEFEQALIENPALTSITTFKKEEGIKLVHSINIMYSLMEKEDMKDIPQFHNLSHVFDNLSIPLYTDFCHLGPRGNELVADAIYQLIDYESYPE